MRIAICDDNAGDRARLEGALDAYLKQRGLSAEVRSFDHPDRLLETVRREDFDVYLLDVIMPMVNGIATARELRSMKGKVPIVFITTSREYSLAAFGVKAVDYVLKPWKPTEFASALDAALATMPREEAVFWTAKTLTGLRRVRPESIVRIETNEDVRHVLVVYLSDGDSFEMRGAVVGLREELSPYLSLVSVGKSLLINPAYLFAIEETRITLSDKVTLEVPKSAIPALRTAMLSV